MKYKFEGSSEVRELNVNSDMKDVELCDVILKSIFEGKPPTCGISIKERKDGIVTLQRVYANKFKSKPVAIKPPRKRRRRWESPKREVRRKRWVSRSPDRRMNRYNAVYTNY